MNMTRPALESYDTETHRIGPDAIAPDIVCCAFADEQDTEIVASVHPDTRELLDSMIEHALDVDGGRRAVFCNAAFDLAVFGSHNPELLPAIFAALDAGHIHCIKIREKLLNLATTGKLDFMELPNGMNIKIGYSLNDMSKLYLDKDRSDDKKATDSWRINFDALEDTPVARWPREALEYVLDDVRDPIHIWHCQEDRREHLIAERGIDPWGAKGDHSVLIHRVKLDFCLYLMGLRGFTPDPKRVLEVKAELEKELSPESMSELIKLGIVIPAQPEQPYANGAKDEDGNPKMKKAQKEKTSKKELEFYVTRDFHIRHPDIELRYTDKGNLQVDSAWLEEFADADSKGVLQQYKHRQSLQKLLTTELPRMMWNGEVAKTVHPNFDQPKETGRTSSFAGKLYPSFNCQNVHAQVRDCFIARPGRVLVSLDYKAMELATLAQTCVNLFGYSVAAQRINQGIDLHTNLGATLAYHLDADFHSSCAEHGVKGVDEVLNAFMACQKSEDAAARKFFGHYRKFAKPTGLGYPGGLGAETMITYAKDTYGVVVDLEMAKLMKDLWLQTYPEMEDYFEYINKQCVDPWNRGYRPSHDGGYDECDSYCYTTPLGMHRAGCSYCAAANGMGLQSPSAEGATGAVVEVVRRVFDSSRNSELFGEVWPLGFVHDEIILDAPLNSDTHELVMEVSDVMVSAMREITPDVAAGAEPALMYIWDKRAEPVYDQNGRITVWTPSEE